MITRFGKKIEKYFSPKDKRSSGTSFKTKTVKGVSKKVVLIEKSPSSLSAFPDKSPQINKNKNNRLNLFTTQNIDMKDSKKRQQYNIVINGKIAYKRGPRNSQMDNTADIIWGPSVDRLTKNNYKKLKNGSRLYYDRGSTAFRGPFLFKKITKGPMIEMTGKDVGYGTNYNFEIATNSLNKHVVYFITSNKKTIKNRKGKKRKSRRRKSRRRKSRRRKSRRKTRK